MINTNRCTLCQPINFDAIVTGITLPFDPYWSAWRNGLELNSPNSCALCTLIYRSLCDNFYDGGSILVLRYNPHFRAVLVAITDREFLQTSSFPKLLCGEYAERWFLEESYKFRFSFACAFLSVNLSAGEPQSDLISRRLPSKNPGSEECLHLGRRWLDTCTQQHGKKCQNVDLNFVPSRLIDVNHQLKEDEVRLVSLPEHDDLGNPTSVKYAALSYCWGTEPFLTTTSSNINSMQQSILISQLPRTIQDAIRVTRYMGLSYLWVDSLCILQGTDTAAQQDWHSESLKMGQTYQSAYFTISAESAAAATTGIFNDRPMPSVDFCAIMKSDADSSMFYLGQHQFSDRKIMEPLHYRGWALQESALSRRLLRFGTKEVSWRCSHAKATETLCESRAFLCGLNVEQMVEANKQGREIHDGWAKIVEDYSRRRLSKESDKLPAIAGLAKVAQKATDDAYAAGIWCEHASQSLLWMHKRGKQEYVRKSEFQAPTWSWASVKGEVCFLKDYIQAPDLIVQLLPSKGLVTTGFHSQYQLSITGLLMQLSTIRRHQFGSYHGGYDNFTPWTSLDSTLGTYLDDLSEIPHKNIRGKDGDPKELWHPYFLFLAQYGDLTAGLIILPVGMGHNRYRRIGMFTGFPAENLGSEQGRTSAVPLWAMKNYLKWDGFQKKPQRKRVILV